MSRASDGTATKVLLPAVHNRDTNNRKQDYADQLKRAALRKRDAVSILGGRCVRCGYNRTSAALHFHHFFGQKNFGLDLLALSNQSWFSILAELEKCEVLCAICQAETHHPNAVSRL